MCFFFTWWLSRCGPHCDMCFSVTYRGNILDHASFCQWLTVPVFLNSPLGNWQSAWEQHTWYPKLLNRCGSYAGKAARNHSFHCQGNLSTDKQSWVASTEPCFSIACFIFIRMDPSHLGLQFLLSLMTPLMEGVSFALHTCYFLHTAWNSYSTASPSSF